MDECSPVVIVGAGSAGLVLAIELARRGVAFRLIEKQSEPFGGSRGKGLQPRTLEVFQDIGVLDAVLQAGGLYPPIRNYAADGTTSDACEAPRRASVAEPYPNSIMLPQSRTEEILRARLLELGHQPEWGTELLAIRIDQDRISATIRTPQGQEELSPRYLVGTDGGRSTVRKQLDIPFPGETRPTRMIIADLPVQSLSFDAWHRWRDAPGGAFALCPLAGTNLFQMAAEIDAESEVDLSSDAIRQLITERTGNANLVAGDPVWTSLYQVSFRLAGHYRVGNTLIVGDAAHIHPPTGGQGLNTSVQDAYNLGWKLAAVLSGAPDALLDSYEGERRPVAAGVLGMSEKLLGAMIEKGDMRRGRETLQLDLHYRASPLTLETRADREGVQAGDRAPDAILHDGHGAPIRLFDLFAHPGFTLLAYRCNGDLSSLASIPSVRLANIDRPDAAYADTTASFRSIYGVAANTLLLVRPDGYIALGAKGDEPGLVLDWLKRWPDLAADMPAHAICAQ